MNLSIITATPAIRLIFTIQFLWSTGYFIFFSVLSPFLYSVFNMTDEKISLIFWVSHILGAIFSWAIGFIQDYWIGARRSLYLGAILVFCGYLIFFLFSYINIPYFFLYPTLALISMGRSIITNAIYVLLGKIYQPSLEDRNIERLITLDYIIMTCGALIGSIMGYLFLELLEAAPTMFLVVGFGYFTISCLVSLRSFLVRTGSQQDFYIMGSRNIIFTTISLIGILIISTYCIMYPTTIYVLAIICVLCCIFFLTTQYLRTSKEKTTYLIFIFILIGELFFYHILFHQVFNLVDLYIKRSIAQISFLGITLEPGFYRIINYIWAILAGMFILILHKKWQQHNGYITVFTQGSIAIILSLISFIILYISTFFMDSMGFISLWWLTGFFLLQSISEVIIVYIGISLFIKLMPKHMTAFGLGMRTTIITSPILLFYSARNIKVLDFTGIDLQNFFSSQFIKIIILGLCLFVPILIIQPILKALYKRKMKKK